MHRIYSDDPQYFQTPIQLLFIIGFTNSSTPATPPLSPECATHTLLTHTVCYTHSLSYHPPQDITNDDSTTTTAASKPSIPSLRSVSSAVADLDTNRTAPTTSRSSYQHSGSVDNIDARDAADPLCATEYVTEMYQHFRKVEARCSTRPTYMAEQPHINEKVSGRDALEQTPSSTPSTYKRTLCDANWLPSYTIAMWYQVLALNDVFEEKRLSVPSISIYKLLP